MKGEITFKGDGDGIIVEGNLMLEGIAGKYEMVYHMWEAMGLSGPEDMARVGTYILARAAADHTTPERTEIVIPIPRNKKEKD